ncbi:hypothetical protein [uncultured Chitinophaga sp.]|uniref:hypothetical protein n=1 Tax=uncultured Chitinophaga sp. TaxID=339340 RepID=UPI0025D426E4|nr:hypothetical protein [uncultured Chitinophaga sp.]
MRILPVLLISLTMAACATTRQLSNTSLNKEETALADSMLTWALDHEAIYTLLDTLKPISSVKYLQYPVAKSATAKDGDPVVTHPDSLPALAAKYARICEKLSKGDHRFIMVPFAQAYGHKRMMEIYAVRKSKFAAVLEQHAAFFNQWGFTAASDPAVVLSVIEFEKPYDRNRAYGYFFGYPDYAVDFFIKAEQDTTVRLVPRDFFAIPVYAGQKGYFTYAMPKGHNPSQIDSVIFRNAQVTLERYKAARSKDKSAVSLWRKWNNY